jgi:ribonucleotide reductase beta subunit family protein with ferritin-like domain
VKKIKYIIAEDEDRHIEVLQKAIKTVVYKNDLYFSDILECVAICTDGLEAWSVLQQHGDV